MSDTFFRAQGKPDEQLFVVVPRWAYRQLQHLRIADEIKATMPHADRRRIKRETRRACQRYDQQQRLQNSSSSPHTR